MVHSGPHEMNNGDRGHMEMTRQGWRHEPDEHVVGKP